MFKITSKFVLPIGHRLSKHKGRCFNIHGHNFTVYVRVKAKELNENNMVMDFSDLKRTVTKVIDNYDHCLILNEKDINDYGEPLKKLGMNVMYFSQDPTAEVLSKILYIDIQEILQKDYPNVLIDSVTVFENENSCATYSED